VRAESVRAESVSAAAAGAAPRLREVSFLISSGSLIDLDAFAVIGPFREDFFIDGIDIEWCFRARACGFRGLMALSEPMPHRFGGGFVRLPLTGLRLIRQPPERLFTFARNQTAMLRLPHMPVWWKARTGASLALRFVVSLGDGLRGAATTALLGGIRAGWRGRFDPVLGHSPHGDR
jgi:rhamnosyltransferase